MPQGISSNELDSIKRGINEFKIQFTIWDAIKSLQTEVDSLNLPKYKKGEQVKVAQNKHIVTDYCYVNGQYVYQLSFLEKEIFNVITVESVISKV